MTTENNIEQKLKKLSEFVNSTGSVKDSVMNRIKNEKPVIACKPRFEYLRRITMHKTIIKFAAAAVAIAAVIAGISIFEKTSSVGWAQVVEQLNCYTKYKCRQRVVREEGPQLPTMNIYHLNLSQRRQEVANGAIIQIFDMRGTDVIILQLHTAQKIGTLTKLIGAGPKEDPDIIDMVKQFEQKAVEKLGTKKQDGKTLYGFRHQPNVYNDFTVWVDEKTKLPVEIEIKHPKSEFGAGQTIFNDEFEFDFNLGPSAFSTDAPEGYKIETIVKDYRPVEPKEITAEDIRQGLNHTAYTVGKLPPIVKLCMIEILDPLGSREKMYVTGIVCNDGNIIILGQGNCYDLTKMVWIPKQQLVFETPNGIKLYGHPNGQIYAQRFLESFAKAKPDFFDIKNLSDERFTMMIVMQNGTVMSLSANKQMSDEKLREFAESLIEIKAN